MEVSVRELKAHLSHYLRAVQGGEPVVITSHDRPVARLERVEALPSRNEAERLACAVGIAWSGGKPGGTRVRLGPGGLSAADIVLDDRR